MFINSLKSTLLVALSATMIPFISQAKTQPNLAINKVNEQKFTVSLITFDGTELNAKVQLPEAKKKKYPVLISMHGMARSQNRVWEATYNGNETIENTHQITQNALNSGVAVIAMDARFHGERKVPELGLAQILQELGNKEYENYNRMISDTVADYTALINSLKQWPMLDLNNIQLFGYSMGAQMALLVAAKHPEIKHVYAMVPPGISVKRAPISPIANANKITNADVILFTSNQDEFADQTDNLQLFNNLATENKLKVEFNSGHLLPEHYVSVLNKLWSL